MSWCLETLLNHLGSWMLFLFFFIKVFVANISIYNVFLPWLDIGGDIEATLESEDGPSFLDFKDMGYNMVNILNYLF